MGAVSDWELKVEFGGGESRVDMVGGSRTKMSLIRPLARRLLV